MCAKGRVSLRFCGKVFSVICGVKEPKGEVLSQGYHSQDRHPDVLKEGRDVLVRTQPLTAHATTVSGFSVESSRAAGDPTGLFAPGVIRLLD